MHMAVLEKMHSSGPCVCVWEELLVLPRSGTGQIGKNKISFPFFIIMKYFILATSQLRMSNATADASAPRLLAFTNDLCQVPPFLLLPNEKLCLE